MGTVGETGSEEESARQVVGKGRGKGRRHRKMGRVKERSKVGSDRKWERIRGTICEGLGYGG